MKTSDNIVLTVSLTLFAVLLFLTDRVARQFTVPSESRQYRLRQSLLSLGAASAAGLILKLIMGRFAKKRSDLDK